MFLKLQKGFSFSSWKGEFYLMRGEKIASVEYTETGGKACMTICGMDATFVMLSSTETFHGTSTSWGGGGKMLYNGEHFYTFIAKTPYEIEVKNAKICYTLFSCKSIGSIELLCLLKRSFISHLIK